MKQTIQDMKGEFNKEINSLKKTQTEIKPEMKNSGCQTKPKEVRRTNRLTDKVGRISCLEDKVKEIDRSVKENVKSKII